ncbi:N-acetylglucosamine kinase [Ornithinibacillus caprae]|nr:BadF/BadG/BcrA/BcrD ATPase family protein [Ornithinibacillus caprae]
MYVIGIDGGGTKTIGAIVDESGHVYAKSEVGPSNPNSVDTSLVKSELEKICYSLREQQPEVFAQVTNVFAGMSGGDHQENQQLLKSILEGCFPKHVKVNIDNDAITALYSGTLGKPGVVQISGTGSITFGVNEHGERQRVGGWGYLFSDYGSGYAIGRDGVSEAFKAYDGITEETVLIRLLEMHYQVTSLPDIIPFIYQSKNPRTELASISKIVSEAADLGDQVAAKIYQKNGEDLGQSIVCLSKKLFPHTCKVPVVLTGGVFKRHDLLMDTMQEVLVKSDIRGEFIIPLVEPIGGAVIAALKEEKAEIHSNFVDNFNQ